MKKTLMVVFAFALLMISAAALAQDAQPSNFYGVAATYAPDSKPAIAGTALWAHKADDKGTYVGGIADFVPTDIKHARVTSNVGAFVAQKLVDIGKVSLFAMTSVALSSNGSNTGWSYTGGGLAEVPIKGGYNALLGVRFFRSNVSGGATGYQLLPSFGIGKHF